MGGRDIADTHIGVHPHNRNIEFFPIPVEPVLDVPALVGVENQNIGFRRAFDAFEHLGQGRDPFQESANVGGEVGAYIRRVPNGIGLGNQIGSHTRGSQHSRMGFREIG